MAIKKLQYFSTRDMGNVIIPNDSKKFFFEDEKKLSSVDNVGIHDQQYKCKNCHCVCHLMRFYDTVEQRNYWIRFANLFQYSYEKYYFINVHPNPINAYALVTVEESGESIDVDVKYLQLKKSVNFGKLIVPDLHWLLSINDIDESKHYKSSKLSKFIYDRWINCENNKNNKYKLIWMKKQLADTVPNDIVIPISSDYDENPLDTLASGYIHNILYGDSEGLITKGKQSKYWFPFFYNYDFPMQIYLINLHPKPKNIFGIYTKYRATDYTSDSEGNFNPIINCNINKIIIPYIEKLSK